MTTSRYFHDREGVWHCNRHATAGRLVMADVTCEPSLGYLVIGHLKGSCATHISHLIAEKSCGKWSIKNSFTTRRGGRARLNAPDSKSDIVARLSGVRIPPSPPSSQQCWHLSHAQRRKPRISANCCDTPLWKRTRDLAAQAYTAQKPDSSPDAYRGVPFRPRFQCPGRASFAWSPDTTAFIRANPIGRFLTSAVTEVLLTVID